MSKLLSLVCIALCIAAVCATHVKPHGQPSHWNRASPVNPSHTMKMSFAVKQQNLDTLESIAKSVSDPKSPFYGKYMTLAEIDELTMNKASMKHVSTFLHTHGATNVVKKGSFIQAELPVKTIQDLFQCEIHHYTNTVNSKVIKKSMGHIMHPSLVAHVDFIGELSHFPSSISAFSAFSPRPMSKLDSGNCDINTLIKTYGISSTKATHPNSTQGKLHMNISTEFIFSYL
jgi:tripeptidyl-peptidase-1